MLKLIKHWINSENWVIHNFLECANMDTNGMRTTYSFDQNSKHRGHLVLCLFVSVSKIFFRTTETKETHIFSQKIDFLKHIFRNKYFKIKQSNQIYFHYFYLKKKKKKKSGPNKKAIPNSSIFF